MARPMAKGISHRFHSFIMRNWVLLVLGLAMTFGLSVFLSMTDMQRDSNILEVMFFLPFCIYAIVVYWAYMTKKATSRIYLDKKEPKKRNASYKEVLYIILAFSILFRAIFVPTVPTLSDDIYRFYWEGKVAANGINPYQYAPDSSQLEKFRDANWDKINNNDVSSPYPPFSQMIFMVSYLAFQSEQSIYVLKVISTIFDILTVIVLFQLLHGFRLDPRLSIIYAWSPLVVIEFAHSGHNDSIALFFTMFSFLALQRGGKMTSAACLALGALTKIFPLIFAPIMFRSWGKKGTVLFLGIIALFYLPYIGAGANLFSGLSAYADRWLFNGSFFPTILRFFLDTGIATGGQQGMLYTKFVLAIPLVLVLGYLVYKSRKNYHNVREIFKYAFVLVGLFLLLTSTVEPWYITWIIPFLVVFISPSWILLSGSVFLSYYIYIRFDTLNIWEETFWVRLLEYIPFFSVLSFEIAYELGSRTEKRTNVRNSRTASRAKVAEEE